MSPFGLTAISAFHYDRALRLRVIVDRSRPHANQRIGGRSMTSEVPKTGIRPNPVGDRPQVDPTAFVDPSAQVMGKVIIGPRVYVGPLSVIRADEVDEKGVV